MDKDKEDGEMSDDFNMSVDEEEDSKSKIIKSDADPQYTILYKAEEDGLVVKALEKVDAEKLEERAKRFGLNLTGSRVITQKQIDDLYAHYEIGTANERHFRFDTLHLNGVDGLTTKEIFEYLEDYKPVSLEWVDDNSCNVVCQDNISTALALLAHSRDIKNEEVKKMLSEKSSLYWREGMPHEKNDLILMRFATKSDKKGMVAKHGDRALKRDQSKILKSNSKNPWGDLCQTWGVYDHQEIWARKLSPEPFDGQEILTGPQKPIRVRNKNLAKRLGKRRHSSVESVESSDSEWKKRTTVPRMRMHADDEESRRKKKRHSSESSISSVEPEEYFAPLSIEVLNTNSKYTPKQVTKLSEKFKRSDAKEPTFDLKDSIHSRLGVKVTTSRLKARDDYSSSEESASSDTPSSGLVMSRVQKVNDNNKKSVWSRLQIQPRSAESQIDLRQRLKSGKSNSNSSDLRDRLGKSKDALLRVEIDNDQYGSD